MSLVTIKLVAPRWKASQARLMGWMTAFFLVSDHGEAVLRTTGTAAVSR